MNDISDEENLVGRIEDDLIAQSLPERATFIPLRQIDLRSKLAEEFSITGDELDDFKHLCARLQAIFHVEHLSALLHLEELYDSLDPDSQLVDLDTIEPAQRNRLANTLMDRLSGLLFSAHYKKLTQHELEAAIEIGCQWGVQLEVDFELFERLEIFARGYKTVKVHRRRWRNFYREETIELPEFQRLIMAFRVKPDPDEDKRKTGDDFLSHKFVYLKTFKNIPETDLEILLPGSKIRLTKMDRAKILLPTLSGMAIVGYKITRGLVVLAFAFTLNNLIVWIAVVGATVGYIVKSVLSYFRTKKKYQFGLTQSLYLKNLDNNSSVIYRILNEAEEQELCEAILAYAMLWKHPNAKRLEPDPQDGMTGRVLDNVVESYLLRITGIDVDFEVHDALGKLARLGLAQVDQDGIWSVAGVKEATDYLNENWNALFESRARAVGTGEPLEDDLFTN